jgi:exosortase/archaeosortase family protein
LAPPPGQATGGRAFVGLFLLGLGLAVVVGVVPHEDPLVGLAVVALGATLLLVAGRLPTLPMRPLHLGVAGALLAVAVALSAATGKPFNAVKWTGLGYGLLLAEAAAYATLWPDRRESRAALQAGGWSLAVLGAPLLVWGTQALFKLTAGTTPTEAFVHYGLLVPVAGLVHGMGWDPAMSGQTLAYSTPSGRIAVDVGAACSGIQAMMLFTAVLALFVWTRRPGNGQLAAWMAIGIAGVYAANLLRLAVLVAVGHEWGLAALMKAHAQAGWLFFAAWALAFSWLATRSVKAPPARAPATPAE